MNELFEQQAAIRNSNRRLSQKFEEALASPLLRPARLKIASGESGADSEEEEEDGPNSGQHGQI